MIEQELVKTVGIEALKEGVEQNTRFLQSVFQPGAEEIGLIIKDKIRHWRLKNILSILNKAQGMLNWDGQDLQLVTNVRVGFSIFENGSVVDDEDLQNMWAGLFASSCTQDGKDDSNLVFVDILRQMSSFEAKILKYACEKSTKYITKSGLVIGDSLIVPLSKIIEIGGSDNITKIDFSFDHMTSLNLFHGNMFSGGGFDPDDSSLTADIGPSALALSLYYKIFAPFGVSVADFWGDQLKEFSAFQEAQEQKAKQEIDEIWNKEVESVEK